MWSAVRNRVVVSVAVAAVSLGAATPVGSVVASESSVRSTDAVPSVGRAPTDEPPRPAGDDEVAGESASGEYVVTLRSAGAALAPRQNPGDLTSRIESVLSRLDESVGGRGAVGAGAPVAESVIAELPIIDGFGVRLSPAEAVVLGTFDEVASVEPNRRFKATATTAGSVAASVTAGPDELPWGLDRIDQKNLPLDGSYNPPGDGAGVTAYVLDGGVWAKHQELKGRVNQPMADFVGDFPSPDQVYPECMRHGTHVAGTIAGTNVGVAPKARVQAVRVLDCEGYGFSLDILRGMNWVADNARLPAVVNMSLGGSLEMATNAAVRYLTAKGITVVVSAGNDTKDACGVSPAAEPSAITVAASDIADAQAAFSNFGPCVDVFAPGVNILSAAVEGPDQYAYNNGTSMSSPHVAGTAALYLSAHPQATPDAVERAIVAGAARVLDDIRPTTPNRLLQVRGLPDPDNRPGTDPVAHITPPPGAGPVDVGEAVTLGGTDSIDPTGGKLTYAWRVQGVEGIVGTNPTFAFTPARVGEIEVTLTVTNAGGVSATDVLPLEVYDARPPVVVVDPENGSVKAVAGDRLSWDASASYDPDGSEVTVDWYYLEGLNNERTTGPRLARTYNGGFDRLLVVVSNDYGAYDYYSINIEPSIGPVAVIDPATTRVSVGDTVLFDGSQSYTVYSNYGYFLLYTWTDTVDGAPVSDQQVYRRTFDEPGTYTVYLTVAAFSGETDTTAATVVVSEVDPPPPVVPAAMSAVEPLRVLDTRLGSGVVGPKGPVASGGVTQFSVGGVPSSAVGVVLNVTAVNPSADGHLTVYPCGRRPGTSNVNYRAGVTSANAVVALLSGRDLCVWSLAATDVVVDVTGFVPDGSAARSMKAVRAIDTRTVVGDEFGRVAAGGVVKVPVSSVAKVPADASAVFVNVTAVNPSAAGHLTVYPCGAVPPTSNVNYRAGVTTANMAVARLASDGSLCVRSFAESDVVVDVLGYVGPGNDVQLGSVRELDTREEVLGVSADQKGQVAGGSMVRVNVGVDAAKTAGVFLSVAAVNPAGDGHLTVFPCGEPPTASMLNYRAGVTTSNMVFSKVDKTGSVCVSTFATTDLVVDYNGKVASSG